ncbi:MAG: thermonuclease family protein [Sphingorhabdus sp.]
MNRSNVNSFPARGIRIGWPAFLVIAAGVSAALFLAIFLSGGPRGSSAAVGAGDPHSASFSYCFGPIRRNCVVDGDTFWFDAGKGARKIRIADINTPELGSARCDYERQLGEQAKDRLRVLLNQGNFRLENIDRDQDKYGRDLRIITRGGKSIGAILVAEGLAEEWQGYRRDWC